MKRAAASAVICDALSWLALVTATAVFKSTEPRGQSCAGVGARRSRPMMLSGRARVARGGEHSASPLPALFSSTCRPDLRVGAVVHSARGAARRNMLRTRQRGARTRPSWPARPARAGGASVTLKAFVQWCFACRGVAYCGAEQ